MYLPVNLLPSPSHKLKVAIEKKHALGDHESSFTYFTTIFYLQDIPIHRIVEKRWVKIYWITKCTTTVLFPPKKMEEERENEIAKPVLNNLFFLVFIRFSPKISAPTVFLLILILLE